YLVDPDSMAVETIGSFGTTSDYSGGHDDGPTSVDEATGHLFVTDRTTRTLSVLDASRRSVVGSVDLGAGPDYVRWAEATGELGVTELAMDRVAISRLPAAAPFNPTLATTISVENGPESLVLDASGTRAYTHRWQAASIVLDVKTHAAVAEWANGCAASRGL